jgi:hypothetical protein
MLQNNVFSLRNELYLVMILTCFVLKIYIVIFLFEHEPVLFSPLIVF